MLRYDSASAFSKETKTNNVSLCVCVYIHTHTFICKILLHFEEMAEVIVRAGESELCKAVWPTRNSCGRWCFILEAEVLCLWWKLVFVLKAIKELWGPFPLLMTISLQWNTTQPSKNETLPFANIQMDSGDTILSEIKLNRERQILYDIAYMWNLKNMMN